jgi:hypothetical protein
MNAMLVFAASIVETEIFNTTIPRNLPINRQLFEK